MSKSIIVSKQCPDFAFCLYVYCTTCSSCLKVCPVLENSGSFSATASSFTTAWELFLLDVHNPDCLISISKENKTFPRKYQYHKFPVLLIKTILYFPMVNDFKYFNKVCLVNEITLLHSNHAGIIIATIIIQ